MHSLIKKQTHWIGWRSIIQLCTRSIDRWCWESHALCKCNCKGGGGGGGGRVTHVYDKFTKMQVRACSTHTLTSAHSLTHFRTIILSFWQQSPSATIFAIIIIIIIVQHRIYIHKYVYILEFRKSYIGAQSRQSIPYVSLTHTSVILAHFCHVYCAALKPRYLGMP